MKNAVAYLFVCALLLNILSCSKTDSTPEAAVPATPVDKCSGQAGTLFTAVKALVQQKCIGCHNNNFAAGGTNLATDCSIVSAQLRIKVRAVDQGNMPPGGSLSQADKDKITNWINAGGRITN